jgi:hypothetical protein
MECARTKLCELSSERPTDIVEALNELDPEIAAWFYCIFFAGLRHCAGFLPLGIRAVFLMQKKRGGERRRGQ